MAAYLKLWTTLIGEPWWTQLTALERGVWISVLLMVKAGGDLGQVSGKNRAGFGLVTGCQGKTFGKILGKFLDLKLWDVEERPNGSITITVHNYQYWQGLKDYGEHLKKGTGTGLRREKVKKIPPKQNSNNRSEQHIQTIIDLYHTNCPSLSKIKAVTDNRIKYANARFEEHPELTFWDEVTKRMEASTFLTNRDKKNRNGWKADFDWMVKPDSLAKIIEGKYDDHADGADIFKEDRERQEKERRAALCQK